MRVHQKESIVSKAKFLSINNINSQNRPDDHLIREIQNFMRKSVEKTQFDLISAIPKCQTPEYIS